MHKEISIKLEQALKYDRLKTEFIANVSHELKNTSKYNIKCGAVIAA